MSDEIDQAVAPRRKKISIVSPCYNEELNVEYCYNTVKELFEKELSSYEREHIFSDNCSSDRTVEILREIAAKDKSVKIILNSRNFGGFRSIFNALTYATGDATLVFLAVDLQDPPELLPEFVRHWESGFEVVAGARRQREEGAILRFCRHVFYRLVNGLSDFEIPPDVGEFQLIDQKVWRVVVNNHDHYPFIRGIIASAGFKRIIVPYTWKRRKHGKSKTNFGALIDQALNGIFSFTNAPLRFCSLVGLGLAGACVLYAMAALALQILEPGLAPPGISTLIVALFFLGGVQLFFIGMLGEYVTAIHAQVRRSNAIVVERELINIDPADRIARKKALES
ncbi:MAG: glycosyltransferase [Alphaproteobacteria bacterium]|nr:MAG: glycosyltransferase [Alphaproteobacteria bacterium]